MKWGLFFLIPFSLYGLYCGNPGAPEIPEKGMFLPITVPVAVHVGYQGDYVFQTSREFSYQMQQGVLTADWIDRVNVFASLGHMMAKGQKGSTWGIGTEVLLFHWNDFLMGINAKYQMAMLPRIKYREWQVAPAIGYEFKYVRPYAGVSYHAIYLRQNRIKIAPEDPYVLFFGFGVTPGKGIALNLEGRVIGEAAFSLSINFRF